MRPQQRLEHAKERERERATQEADREGGEIKEPARVGTADEFASSPDEHIRLEHDVVQELLVEPVRRPVHLDEQRQRPRVLENKKQGKMKQRG